MSKWAEADVESFVARLRRAVAACRTGLCVGIDPPLGGPSQFFRRELERCGPDAYLDAYCAALLGAAVGVVPAVKFQSAYFEAHGAAGVGALRRGLAAAKRRGLLAILDAKRGDIADTMGAYGQAAFDVMGADALTVTPYMGLDVLAPLLPWLKAGRGAYVVWISSNPLGALVQDPVATRLLDAVQDFDREHAVEVGLVLGATKVEQLAESVWARLRQTPLLMPGVGAQGAMVTPRIQDMLARSGVVLVPMSRGLAEPPGDCAGWQDFGRAVRARCTALAAQMRV